MADFKNEFTYKKFVESGREDDFDRAFDDAVTKVRKEALGKKHPIYINGKEVFADAEIIEYSPIDKTVIGIFQKGNRETAKLAIQSASSAFSEWKTAGYKERAEIFEKAADMFSQRKFEVSAILSIENGKSRYESVGEVDEAIDFLRYYSTDIIKNRGYVRRNALSASTASVKAGFQGAPGRSEKVSIAMKPYGVFGVIAPFNFPISISVGMSAGALITGNTVVFKPSSTDNMTMLTGIEIYKIFTEAGVPPGVFNFITGPGSEVGDELVVNGNVSGIAFTGSRMAGINMLKKSYDLGHQKVFVVEMGGKNPVKSNVNLFPTIYHPSAMCCLLCCLPISFKCSPAYQRTYVILLFQWIPYLKCPYRVQQLAYELLPCRFMDIYTGCRTALLACESERCACDSRCGIVKVSVF